MRVLTPWMHSVEEIVPVRALPVRHDAVQEHAGIGIMFGSINFIISACASIFNIFDTELEGLPSSAP